MSDFSESLCIFRSVIFSVVSIPIALTDIRCRRIPDSLSLGMLALLMVFDSLTAISSFFTNMAAGIVAFLVFVFIRRATKSLGFGDVKYAAVLGFFVGLRFLPLAFLVAATGGLAYAFLTSRFTKTTGDGRIPFGPFLSAGGIASAICMIFAIHSAG